MSHQQLSFFDLEQFTTPVINSAYDYTLDKPENLESTVLEQTSEVAKPYSTVLEQAQADTNQVAPEQCHWVEKYKVTRYNKEHYYYRYVWMEGRKLHHVHIGGGNVKSTIAIVRKEKVEMAIADGQTPIEIKQMLRGNNETNN